MSLFFISGVSGTGKTVLMHELRRRGEAAYDTDEKCIRLSKRTGKVVNYDDSKIEGYNWIYPTEALRAVKQESLAKNVFLLGSVDNTDEIKLAADEHIWMSIPLDLLLTRLASRAKEYGKSDSERQALINLHEQMNTAVDPNLFILDATKPVEQIANDLLSHVVSDRI